MFKDWINLLAHLKENNYSTKDYVCPECNQKSIEYVYVGWSGTNIVYLPIWCNKCNKGIQISRVEIPEGAKKINATETP